MCQFEIIHHLPGETKRLLQPMCVALNMSLRYRMRPFDARECRSVSDGSGADDPHSMSLRGGSLLVIEEDRTQSSPMAGVQGDLHGSPGGSPGD